MHHRREKEELELTPSLKAEATAHHLLSGADVDTRIGTLVLCFQSQVVSWNVSPVPSPSELSSKHEGWHFLHLLRDLPAEVSIKGSEEAVESKLKYKLDVIPPRDEIITIRVCQVSVLSFGF